MRAKEFIYERSLKHRVADEDYDPNGPPPGPEFKPTMPKGTVKVDVSDVYDWYKLGQHISNLKGLGKHDFGSGPPSTIMAFGDEDTEHKYINDLEKTGLTTTDIDPVDPNQPKGMKRQKVDPTYNVGEGVAEDPENNKTTAQKIFFARSNIAPKGWSYDHVGFITQDGKQIQMSGHKGNEVYVTNAVTDDPEFPKQKIKIVSLSKPVSVPTTNSVGAENCGTFVANVLQANGIKGIDTQKLYSVMREPLKQGVAEGKSL